MTRIRIRNGRLIDPSQRRDEVVDVVLVDGRVHGYLGAHEAGQFDREIDATGMVVAPGFVDLHTHLREPGFEDKETVATGTHAAVAGGFTTVCAMPNTNPTMDTANDIVFVIEAGRRAGFARVYPLGTVTRGEQGKALSDTSEMAQAGAIAFSDDGRPVYDARLMRYALTNSLKHHKPIVNHCEEPEIADGGVMHEGRISDLLGLKGQPAAAEEVMIARDIELARQTGGRLHLAHISTEGSVKLLRAAKRDGLPVTAEVTPHHLTMTEEWVLGNVDGGSGPSARPGPYDTRTKVNPPLRREEDRQAMVAALAEGLVDVIATDHAPHRSIDKDCTYDEASFGISGLETALGSLMKLVDAGQISLADVIARLTVDPCRIFDLPNGTLAVGQAADMVIFDPAATWVVSARDFKSKGKNTPLDGHSLKGLVRYTLVGGEVVFEQGGPVTKTMLTAQTYVDANACLALEDGRVFYGQSFGAPVDAEGEVVFNTSMTGYQEIATDPSYHGQMVVLTHPQIGNYGAQLEARESKQPWVAALIVRDLAEHPNHWLANGGLSELLAAAGVPAMQRVDTRALTRHLRNRGTMRAALGHVDNSRPLPPQAAALVTRAQQATPLSDKNLVEQASDPLSVNGRTDRTVVGRAAPSRLKIALVDCGVKHNIARSLAARGAELVPIAWNAPLDEVLATGAQGVVISNGPGDPERMDAAAELVRGLLGRAVPTMGICLGHQVFGLAAGGTTSRLKFGHHGGNHPVRDLTTGRVYITSQNHEFQVDAASIREGSGFVVSLVNLNDGSVEGLAHRELPAFSVQYHPEGCPGPQDNQYVFERFLDMVASPAPGLDAMTRVTQAELSIGSTGG